VSCNIATSYTTDGRHSACLCWTLAKNETGTRLLDAKIRSGSGQYGKITSAHCTYGTYRLRTRVWSHLDMQCYCWPCTRLRRLQSTI